MSIQEHFQQANDGVVIRVTVFYNGKEYGYERLTKHGWFWRVPQLDADNYERWVGGTMQFHNDDAKITRTIEYASKDSNSKEPTFIKNENYYRTKIENELWRAKKQVEDSIIEMSPEYKRGFEMFGRMLNDILLSQVKDSKQWSEKQYQRVELIDDTGRCFHRREDNGFDVRLSEQDEGRTLKIFVKQSLNQS